MGHLGLDSSFGRRDDQPRTLQDTTMDLATSLVGNHHSLLPQMIHFVIYYVPLYIYFSLLDFRDVIKRVKCHKLTLRQIQVYSHGVAI